MFQSLHIIQQNHELLYLPTDHTEYAKKLVVAIFELQPVWGILFHELNNSLFECLNLANGATVDIDTPSINIPPLNHVIQGIMGKGTLTDPRVSADANNSLYFDRFYQLLAFVIVTDEARHSRRSGQEEWLLLDYCGLAGLESTEDFSGAVALRV